MCKTLPEHLHEECSPRPAPIVNAETIAKAGCDQQHCDTKQALCPQCALLRTEDALRESEERYQTLTRILPVGVFRADAGGGCTYVNERWCEIAGLSPEEAMGDGWQKALHSEDRQRVFAAWTEAVTKSASFLDEYRFRRGDDQETWVLGQAVAEKGADGTLAGFVGSITDITERKRAEEKLHLSARVFESSAEGITITDANQTIIAVNQAFTRLTGYSEEEATGQKPSLLSSGLHDAGFHRAMWRTIRQSGQWQGEIWGRRKDGELFATMATISKVTNERGEILNYIGIFNDITAAKESQKRMEYMASHDTLTGLPNRQLFHDRLAHAIERSERGTGKLAIMFLDLDNFKIVNDTLGHHHGDLLLKEVAARVKKLLRKKDTLARLGGDEFTIVIEDTWTIAVDTTAQRVIEALSQPIDLAGREVFVSGSIGISVYPDDGKNISDLLKKADTAMYRAKEQGKNAYRFFEEKMNARAIERLTIETALRRALERNEFFLAYQPQVAIGLGEVTSVEALIRWRHPGLGLIYPARFIHIAEDTGLIEPIGEWVLETACRQIRQWEQAGLFPPAVAVNLSPRQFRKGNIARNMERILARTNVSPVLVGAELTESALIEDPKQTIKTMSELKEMGIHLSLDDFGTGNSSLSQLRRLPLDELKIDKSFIDEVHHNPDDAAIVSAIVTLGHNLGMIVVAEGVETIEQLNSLHTRGCDVVQGYYYSKPLLPDEMADYLKERRWGKGHW